MMTLSREEYLEQIFDHKDTPYHRYRMDASDISGSGGNPGCGDIVTIYVKLGTDGSIREAAFEGDGCTISQAAASIITEMIEGKSVEEVLSMTYDDIIDTMGRDVVITRTRCATLALSVVKQSLTRHAHDLGDASDGIEAAQHPISQKRGTGQPT